MPRLGLAVTVAALFAGLATAALAETQVRFRDIARCRTPQGEHPDIIVTTKMGAGARRSLDGRRTVIVLNPRQHRTWQMRLAVFFHECAHFSQPRGVGERRILAERRKLELRADCVGIRMMAERRLLSRSGWRYIYRRVNRMKEGRSRRHPAGAVRAANMVRCLSGLRHLILPDHRVPNITRW